MAAVDRVFNDDLTTLRTALRNIVKEEIENVISEKGLSEYELDDKIYERSQEAVDNFMSDNLDDRIAEYVDSNIAELLNGKITVTVE